MNQYICDCERLALPRADYCAACNAYKQMEAERDAAVKALEVITRRVPIMGSTSDYREGQLHALEACSEVARAAIDAARG